MIKPKKKKNSSFKMPKIFDEKYLGPEPVFNTPLIENDIRLGRAFNWYNYFYKLDEAKPWVLDYMKKSDAYSKKDIRLFTANKHESMTACSIAKMLSRGIVIPEKHVTYMKTKIADTINNLEVVDDDKTIIKKPNIQDRIKNVVNNMFGDIDEEIDTFTSGKYDHVFSVLDYLNKNEISQTIASKIPSYYFDLNKELDLLVKNNKDVSEGYDISKKNAKLYSAFIKQIIDDANLYCQNKKRTTVRLPRKKKIKSAEQLTSKMKYAQGIGEYNIVGLTPSSIIGASTVWLYNVKTKQVSFYNAVDTKGFTVKGSKIMNYDTETSIKKTLRKPHVSITELMNAGKVSLKKYMDTLTTKSAPVNGSVNGDTVILRIGK